MKSALSRLYSLLTVLALACVAGSCVPRYTLNGSSINYDIYKTINIGEFPIRAALVYPPLQQTFENELLNYVTRNTRLQELDGNKGDLQLSGEITGYSLSPQAVGTDAYATETRLHHGARQIHRQQELRQRYRSEFLRLPPVRLFADAYRRPGGTLPGNQQRTR